ncbi:SIMPL domain-containing protein [uncultured Maribacter sp.]|uniref:SIMPL domain-containing protein n=1 Tax=uncultured Maribacter sp. TaxID=431308 RepID=UPI002616E60F|nr:SIMPL domain-containing protein [uncultured Maribacter sp.]
MTTLKGFSQQNKNSINVTGVHTIKTNPTYTASMIVSLNNVYYDSQTMSLDEIKSNYINKLAKEGIPNSSLKENQLQYDLMGYEKNGVFLEFKSNSVAEMQKFLKVRSMGVSKLEYKYEIKFTEKQIADYAKGAFDNAKKKAEAIAKKLGKQVGPIISFTDNNVNKISQSWYYGNPTDSMDYNISVSFELL